MNLDLYKISELQVSNHDLQQISLLLRKMAAFRLACVLGCAAPAWALVGAAQRAPRATALHAVDPVLVGGAAVAVTGVATPAPVSTSHISLSLSLVSTHDHEALNSLCDKHVSTRGCCSKVNAALGQGNMFSNRSKAGKTDRSQSPSIRTVPGERVSPTHGASLFRGRGARKRRLRRRVGRLWFGKFDPRSTIRSWACSCSAPRSSISATPESIFVVGE